MSVLYIQKSKLPFSKGIVRFSEALLMGPTTNGTHKFCAVLTDKSVLCKHFMYAVRVFGTKKLCFTNSLVLTNYVIICMMVTEVL